MTEKCEAKWSSSHDQMANIIILSMQATVKQFAGYAKELICPPGFIALMLRDIADAFEENPPYGCDCS